MILIVRIPESNELASSYYIMDVSAFFPGTPECQFYVWAILAFLGLALVISLIFNVFHYVEKHRQGKAFWEIVIWYLLEWRLSHWKTYRRQFYEMSSNRIFLSIENLFDTFFHSEGSLNLRM